MWYITRHYIRLILWSWGPVLAAMAVMFIASAQPKHTLTVEPPTIYFSGIMPIFPGIWDVLVKKSGHLIAYGALALLNARAMLLWQQPIRRTMLLAITFTVGYAALDELHQLFVPGRHASLMDIAIDLSGAVLFVLITRRVYPAAKERTA